jgi:hypothetical protein
MTFGEEAGIAIGVLGIVAPEWLPSMNKTLRNVITIAGFALLAQSGILLIEDLTGASMSKGPLLVVILGALVIAGGVLWHIQVDGPKGQKPEPSLDSKPVNTMGSVTGNSGVVTQGQQGDNKQR